MSLIPWKNLPDTTTPVNAENLIYNFNELFNLIYPVGSIYINTTGTNPSTFFGGTWVPWGSGRVPVGVDTSQEEFNIAEKTGGEKQHRHDFKIALWDCNYSPAGGYAGMGTPSSNSAGAFKYSTGEFAGAQPNGTVSQKTGTTGAQETKTTNLEVSEGDTTLNSNLSPYITCYMWKKTA